MEVRLSSHEWLIGDQIAPGVGAFGRVFKASAGSTRGAAKFVPKQPGADREMLLARDASGARNVVPLLDWGETDTDWVIVMPLATRSLRDRLNVGVPELAEAVKIWTDIATALADLDGRVVHRDLKPENVLELDGAWKIADFGIARYAAASTSPDTQKLAMTPAYASPEQWRFEHATQAADVYAAGVLAYELLSGRRPFDGPTREDFREQHLTQAPPPLPVTSRLAALVEECLSKAAQARPTAANIVARLERFQTRLPTSGVAALEKAHHAEVSRRAEEGRQQSIASAEALRRADLYAEAQHRLGRVTTELHETILDAAPTTAVKPHQGIVVLSLGRASLGVQAAVQVDPKVWRNYPPAFDVIASSTIVLTQIAAQYEGRGHSLWFCDSLRGGQYAWYETAFMDTPTGINAPMQSREPFDLSPGEAAGGALSNTMTAIQVAWPFSPVALDDSEDFIDRWVNWFAKASQGELSRPSRLPERSDVRNWRD